MTVTTRKTQKRKRVIKMPESGESLHGFQQVNDRLKQISEEITDDMPLDKALDLLEEAVGLGVKASSLIETDIEEHAHASESPSAEEAADAHGAAVVDSSQSNDTSAAGDGSAFDGEHGRS